MGAPRSNRKRSDEQFSTFNHKFGSLHLHTPSLDPHVPKKLKFSPSPQHSRFDHPEFCFGSAVSKIAQYPKKILQFKGPVHAPCKGTKFRSFSGKGNSGGSFGGVKMGNVVSDYFITRKEALGGVRLIDVDGKEERKIDENVADVEMGNVYSNYDNAFNVAKDSLRFYGKGKEVIDIDDYADEEERKTNQIDDKGKEVIDIDDYADEEERKTNQIDDSSVERVAIVEDGKGRWRECNDVAVLDLSGKIGDQKRSCSSGISEDISNANFELDSGGKVFDVVSMSRESYVPTGSLLKKLLDSVNKRDGKLKNIGFWLEYWHKKISALQLFRPAKKPVKDVSREELFVPLTKEEEDEVSRALSNANRSRVLVTHEKSNIEITGKLLQCLRPGAWLNDEVINVYLGLLKEREMREPQKFLKCHFFNTFFYKKLIGASCGYDFKSVRKWTTQRKLGYCLIDCDKIFVPIHKEVHWCLAVINKKDEKFQYLDSLGGKDKQVMKVLARYFVDEVKDKRGKEIDVSSWKQEYLEDLPEQQNGYDCGMFMIKYTDFYSRDVGLCFNQEHVRYFRRRTAKEILRLKAD